MSAALKWWRTLNIDTQYRCMKFHFPNTYMDSPVEDKDIEVIHRREYPNLYKSNKNPSALADLSGRHSK